jgi:hypothetical protein
LPGPGPIGVTSVVGKVPAVVIHGDKKLKASLSVTVRNDGVAFSSRLKVAVLASRDAIADVDDITIAQSSKPIKFKIGQTKAVKLKLPLATVPVGAYQLLGIATAEDLTSSAAGPAVNVEAPVVHLVSSGSAPPGKPIHAGKNAALSIPLRNDGNVKTTKAPATYTLILSTDGAETGSVYQTTATGRISLKPGQARSQKVNVALPAGTASGTYTVLVMLTTELNDTNGQVLAALPATIS